MNQYQRIAFKYPCFEAEETAHPRFYHVEHTSLFPGSFWSVGLTMNVGLE